MRQYVREGEGISNNKNINKQQATQDTATKYRVMWGMIEDRLYIQLSIEHSIQTKLSGASVPLANAFLFQAF